MADLDGRIALVTGGARGIGLGCCECLAEQGATVVVADIDLGAAEAAAEGLGGAAIAVEHDVASAASAAGVAATLTERFGHLDVLVNNAGVGPRPGPVQDTTEQEYDRVMDINARGTFLSVRALVPLIIGRPAGRIINVSSIVGQTGVAMVLPYVASKFAVRGMTESLAVELAPHDITVNSVHPGIVVTDLHSAVVKQFGQLQDISEEESWDWFMQRIPLQRFQTPRDLGEMTAFLASDRAKNITGGSFNVDGGWEMH